MEFDKTDKHIDQLLVNIALNYAYLRRFDEADKQIANVFMRCGSNCQPVVLQNAAFCRGIVALGRADTVAARQYFLTSYEKSNEVGDDRIALDNIIYLSRLYLNSNEFGKAEVFLAKAEALIVAGTPYNMELIKVYGEFVSLFEKKGDYIKVALFQKRYINLKDSIYDDEMTTSLMRIEAAHVEKEKNAEIETQNRILELNAINIARQRMATISMAISAVLLAALVAVLVRVIRNKRLRNEDLERRVKNRTIELEQAANLLQRLVAEKDLRVKRLLSNVRHAVASITGLCTIAGRESNPDYTNECIGRIGQASDQLLKTTHQFARLNASPDAIE
jgi:hypothetical protein